MAINRSLIRSQVARRSIGVAMCGLVLGLLGLQLATDRASARRAVGVYLEEAGGGLLVTEVEPGEPADRGGLQPGDVVHGLAGRQVETALDWDAAIQSLEPGETVRVDIERDGDPATLVLRPGRPFDGWSFVLSALTSLVHLALATLVLSLTARGRRVNLLLVLLWSIALECALPLELIGAPRLSPAIGVVFWLLTGLQFGIELNLASLIPSRHRWLDRAPWAPPLFYAAGLGYGLVGMAGEIPALAASRWMAWSQTTAGVWLLEGWYLLWPLGVFTLLAGAAFRWPEPTGRNQALLVLMGTVPWVLLGLTLAARSALDLPYSHFLETIEPLVLLLYPLAIFVALYRFRLFDFQLVVRKGLVYSILVGALLLGFYGALGGAGVFLSTFVEDPTASVWVVAGATLVLGLLFAPLKRVLEAQIERRLFPERLALRRRLAELARELPRQGSLPAICQQLVSELREIFALRGVALCLSEGESALLLRRAASPKGIFGGSCQPLSLSDDDPLMRTLAERHRPVTLDSGPAPSDLAARLRGAGVARIQPVAGGDRLQGLLLLGGKSHGADLPAEEGELLDLFSAHIAAILENARLFESARTDGLTGLLRREPLLARLETEFDRAVRYHRPLTVAMLDLDRFKRANDRHGHLLGDVMLQRVAATVAEGLRKTDAVGRFGGDELVVLLPETTPDGATRVCEELRRRVEEVEVATPGGQPVRVTASIGLASLQPHSGPQWATTADMVRAADSALYRAKEVGGNRVRHFGQIEGRVRRSVG